MAPHSSVRPRAEYLRSLPTLRVSTPETDGVEMQQFCRARHFDYRLELKLETEETRYWLITRCVGAGIPGWHEGGVVAESV
jgi:hypothetical protein